MEKAPNQTTVLVSGGSGYIGSHTVHLLLKEGYNVRTTVRSLKKSDQVRRIVAVEGDSSADSRLSFFEADLLSDKGWTEAAAGCDYVLHVASPFPLQAPKNEDELIKPAVEGTLRALRAAADAKVKRVVVTSSFAAIGYGHKDNTIVFDENVWSDEKGGIGAYEKSKLRAERAAWDFVKQHPEMEMATVNPVGVFGPLLPGSRDVGSTVGIVQRILNGGLPAAPQITLGAVDVRDVALMHLQAMTLPEAAGQRFLAVQGEGEFIRLSQMGEPIGIKIRQLPNWLTRLLAPFVADLKMTVSMLGIQQRSSNARARNVLGIKFIPWEQSVKDTAASLRAEKLVK